MRVTVRLSSWSDTSTSKRVAVSSYDDLRRETGDQPKLYFFDETNGKPRGTYRVKLDGQHAFDTLRQQIQPVTVYTYLPHDGGPVSPPEKEQPMGAAAASVPTASSESSRSSALREQFKDNVAARYELVGDTIRCFLCELVEDFSTTGAFAACHLIPYSSPRHTFAEYGLLSGKTDALNGVFMCHVCHQFHDNGHWQFHPVEDCGDHFEGTVVVSDGLKDTSSDWADRAGTVKRIAKGEHYPPLSVWHGAYKLNFLEPQEKRARRRRERKYRCTRCGKVYKDPFKKHKCETSTRSFTVHSGRKEKPLRRGADVVLATPPPLLFPTADADADTRSEPTPRGAASAWHANVGGGRGHQRARPSAKKK